MAPMIRLQRMGVLLLMALAAVNVWTGAPLAALWIGARLQGDTTAVKMSSVFAVIVCLGIFAALLVQAMTRLSHKYDELSNIVQPRRQAPWMRSMRGDRPEELIARKSSAAEKVVIGAVLLAILCFEVWFFFFSGSSIGGAGGRG